MHLIPHLITLNGLGRKLNRAYPTMLRLKALELLQPDFELESGNVQLFRLDRLPELKKLVNQNVGVTRKAA